MKKFIVLIVLVAAALLSLSAQSESVQSKILKRNTVSLMKFNATALNSNKFANQYFQKLGLSSAEDLKVFKTMKGLNGWTRTRMKQYYQGLTVVGSAYILHEKDGIVKKATGDLLPYIDISTTPSIDASAARLAAASAVNTTLLSKTGGAATVLPDWHYDKTELVVIDKAYPAFSGDYTLAYHVIVANVEGANQYIQSVYVDANQSNIIASISEIAHTNVEGIANTNYYGQQTITVDSVASDLYVLQDFTRGDGIITLNSRFQDFEDIDNFWNNFGNKEEVGTDAHYCAAAYYDYMQDNFNWDGLDGEGSELRSRVFGAELNAVNATWNGRDSIATFFSGDCDQYGPLTTLLIVGHEFAHGFTEFTSGLIYQDESGALNEGISDILGKALEMTYDPEEKNWLIGAKILLTDNDDHFRDMADPNAKNNPKLYAGEFWEFGIRDNGGVHINSGVLNFWFHMLTEGKTDVNELGIAYDVEAIGLEKAAAIIFTMNTAYLTETSTYTKAVTASIETVRDLYGDNSAEMVSVLEAWKAVGLFPESGDYDLSLTLIEDNITVCIDDLGNQFLEVYVKNIGLQSYAVGDEMKFSYTIEGELEAEQTLILQEDLNAGDTLFYTFPEAVPLASAGIDLDIEVELEATAALDPNGSELLVTNNIDEGRIRTNVNSGLDVRVTNIRLTPLQTCVPDTISRIQITLQNLGCENVVTGAYPVTLLAAGSEYNYELNFGNISSGNFGAVTTSLAIPEEIQNGEQLTFIVSLPGDLDSENNTFEAQYLFLETINEGFEETFSNFDVNADTRVFVDSDFRSDAQIGEYNGNEMLVISSLSNTPFLENCAEEDLFFRENSQKTDIDLCINAVGLVEPTFSFDLVQFRSENDLENVDPSYASMAQVTIDGEVFPLIYDQQEGEIVKHQFPLEDDFEGQILIELITLRGAGAFVFDNDFSGADYALIDNVRLTSGTVSTKDAEVPDDISVYPNPSRAEFFFTTTNEQAFDLMIYDGLGQQHANIKSARQQVSWNSQSLAEGVYFYELIFAGGGKRQGKLVVAGR